MPAAQESSIESTIEALYLAVTDEHRWSEALAGLSRVFDSPRVAILRTPPGVDGLYEMRTLNHDPSTQQLYRDYYWALDPTLPATREAATGGWLDAEPLLNPRHTPEPEYTDFAIRHGIRYVAGGKVHLDDNSCTLLGLQRPADHQPFGDEHRLAFERLGRHIARVSVLSAELRQAEIAKGLAFAALDALHSPVYAVSSTGRLMLANRAGEIHLARQAPLSIRFGRLHCRSPEGALALESALKAVSLARGSAFRLFEKGAQWLVRVLPVSGYAGIALLYVTAADTAPIPANVLRQLLHFTQAEAEIAFQLADGLSIKEIAFARRVSVNTVRTQVREIYRKSGVRRQSELNRILFGIPQLVDTDGTSS